MKHEQKNLKRYEVRLYGIVQGVGFRPYIYNMANIFRIRGWVSNCGSALSMDIEGDRNDIRDFLHRIIKNPPPLAEVEKLEAVSKKYAGRSDFIIKPSESVEHELKFIGRDVGICDDCLNEIKNTDNRRYSYAFTNCTNCGPRYSIIRGLPYDRKNTTMDCFRLCPDCQREYDDPSNRRFHAQPNCCPRCGPELTLIKSGDFSQLDDNIYDKPVYAAVERLKQGKILALKGLGGFHLACDAENERAVYLLRQRKSRPCKPFAIMAKDMETAKRLCCIDEVEERILSSNKRPIVLLRKKEICILPQAVAPGMAHLGVMLPYTPLHHLLFENGISYLVMTSGNTSSLPIEYENHSAIENLSGIADYFLLHNREIHVPVEDSVVKVVNAIEIVVRRGRGYSPYIFPSKTKSQILALGGEEKSSFCLSQNGYVYMSQYLGDLKNLETYLRYGKAIQNLSELLHSHSQLIAHDLHSRYMSSKYAMGLPQKKTVIQHHHAHMVSCMVEHGMYRPVIGVVFDGTGLGTDGKIWGGEFFVGTRKEFLRRGHFAYVRIQGGDRAIMEPWRIAASYLHSMKLEYANIGNETDENSINVLSQALDANLNCFETSSVGRLFDCVAALLGICKKITYDAQAAIELENAMETALSGYEDTDSKTENSYEFCIGEQKEMFEIDYKKILSGVLDDMKKRVPNSRISFKFHNTIGNAASEMVKKIGDMYGLKKVVLSGGVFENNYLLGYLVRSLKDMGFEVYHNQQIPTNDNGISVGQLAIAAAMEGD